MQMSRAKKFAGVAFTCLLAGSLAPASAEELPAPLFRAERTYVHCGETPKASVVDVAQGNLPTWDTTAPTTGVQQGAGCGTFDTEFSQFGGDDGADNVDNTFDMVWEGTFSGNLDSIVVRAHAIWAGTGRVQQAGTPAGLSVRLRVDGERVDLPVVVTPEVVPSSTGASSEYIFTVEGLGLIDPVTDADEDGVADDEGTTERTIRLSLSPKGSYSAGMVWVWDTTEVPSGLHFNGPSEGTVLTPGS